MSRHLLTAALLLSTLPVSALASHLEEIHVWAKAPDKRAASYTGPTSVTRPADWQAINAVTTEDLVKYEPSLVIRRRYIGDSNGTLGLRGASMFQTSRSMVFADGVPLHYFLQSRWNGAPRWTMVSASEIAQTEIIYGPFSAEYSGNAMGGVVEIETAIPQQRQAHIDGMVYSQAVDQYGFKDDLTGFKGFASVGDKIGDFSYYLSYNHLDNDSQPQSFRYATAAPSSATDTASGGIPGTDAYDRSVIYYADTGVETAITDNYKIKLGYDLGEWQTLLNLAYEDRSTDIDQPNSYLTNPAGTTLWSGTVIENGQRYSLSPSSLGISYLDRNSRSIGLRLRGPLRDKLALEANLNRFDILKDVTRTSARNPNDPAYTLAGQVQKYNDSGWQTADIKLTASDALGVSGLQWSNGARLEQYQLNLDVFNSNNYLAASTDSYRSRFGGETQLLGLFTQASWEITPQWQVSTGVRYEEFDSDKGYFDDDDVTTTVFDLAQVPSESRAATSPKFALGWLPNEQWQLRYSLARAYRFPIVEELFSQYQAYNTIAQANPGLDPEKGLHHNLMLERTLDQGYVRLNLFQETIEDAIEAQSTLLPGGVSLRTFIPIDKTETQGAELVFNQQGWWLPQLDLRFNLTWLQSEIVDNAADRSLEGKQLPRQPKWRSNLLATYHLTPRWNVAVSVQHADDSFSSLNNSDWADKTFGAIDGYTFTGLKSTLKLSNSLEWGVGVDNLTDQRAYVAHPWPGRTVYTSLSWDL